MIGKCYGMDSRRLGRGAKSLTPRTLALSLGYRCSRDRIAEAARQLPRIMRALLPQGGLPMDQDMIARLTIREIVENWAVWRDAGDWERFETVWHDDAVMMATWFQG